MPDGDIVHDKLSRPYQKPYQWLCEGVASIDKCALELIKALKQDLATKGDLPVQLARDIADQLSTVLNNCSLSPVSEVDWPALNEKCEAIVRQARGSHNVKELTLNSAKKLLHDLRYGKKIQLDNACERILEYYIRAIYISSFKERLPQTHIHHNNLDETMLLEKINEIEPTIESVLKSWAKKLVKIGSFSKLKKNIADKEAPIDMEEDISWSA